MQLAYRLTEQLLFFIISGQKREKAVNFPLLLSLFGNKPHQMIILVTVLKEQTNHPIHDYFHLINDFLAKANLDQSTEQHHT